ncbi:transcription initiation factor IIF subunit alpha [Cucumis melo var. makuwa]|uniref:Transcription initiation factor IIF subunit alpha n=1 Tax=Cucumis melo var. makuwa TaxID=1194695 RepID=A0A5A7VGM7_CUCMM|nr:transcription initiation factor IIF subunit alpha [Cucumis melo var. makuwa]
MDSLQDEEDEDEENEGEGGLSKSGKELKKLLRRTGGLNDSDGEDDEDDDDVDEDTGGTPVLPSKQKDTVKEEAAANSPSKPTPSGSAKGTPSTAKTAKGKRKNGEDVKPSSAPPKKMKTETELKPTDEGVPTSKSTASKGAPASVKTEPSSHSGPVTEEEIRAVLRQRTPVTTQDLVAKFKARLRTPEDKNAFAEILRRISRIQKINGGPSYVVLRKPED